MSSGATHRLPRFDATASAKDCATGVAAGYLKPETADHIMAIVKKRHGELMPTTACRQCGAQLLENLTTGRYEMEHDWAKHNGGEAQRMASAADEVERLRAQTLARARREDDE